MGTVDIPWPSSHSPGTHFQESGGRIINGYVEPLADTAPSPIVYRRAPGLRNFGTSARTGYRGSVEVAGLLYSAFNGQLERWTSAGGASVNVGALTGTKKGFFARNNAVTPDKVFVDPDNNIAVFTTTSVTNSYPDPNLPAVNSCCSIDGYLVFTTGAGRAYATGLNTTAVNALSFGTAEAKPDGLLRCVPWNGQLFLHGTATTEVWSNAGTTPFPFARAIVLQRGIAGPYCVAGHEDGFGKALVLIGDDNGVYQITPNSYALTKISPPDLDGLIEAVTDKTQLEISVFMSRGHAFVLVQSPTWSWVFDLNTSKWAERTSYNGGNPTRSRIIGGISVFSKWLCGDRITGNMQEITNLAYKEITDPFRFRLESGSVEKFPVGSRVGRADFNFVTGVGVAAGVDPIETNPTVEISWSDDGGQTYGAPLLRKLGRQSTTRGLVSLVACTGRSSWNGRRWRIDIADPVYVGFMNATQSTSPQVRDL